MMCLVDEYGKPRQSADAAAQFVCKAFALIGRVRKEGNASVCHGHTIEDDLLRVRDGDESDEIRLCLMQCDFLHVWVLRPRRVLLTFARVQHLEFEQSTHL